MTAAEIVSLKWRGDYAMSREEERAFLEANPPRREEVRRSWRERLFARPWRPWVATRITWYDPHAQRRTVFLWGKVHESVIASLREITPEYELVMGRE